MSATDGRHRPLRLDKAGSPNAVAMRLPPHLTLDQAGQLGIGDALAQRTAQVYLALGEQAVADLAVRGQADPITGRTERGRHAGDDSDDRRSAVDEEQLGGAAPLATSGRGVSVNRVESCVRISSAVTI